MLADGKVFDSSYDKAEPAELDMKALISGLKTALQAVPEGSKLRIRIPDSLAYGNQPPPNSLIPPNAELIFDVEIIDVK